MARDIDALPYSAVRREDRAVSDDDWIRALLHASPVGTLATLRGEQPFLNTNLFVYAEDEHAIYMHTASTGRTRTNITGDERICFTVSRMGRLLPADTAKEFSVEYASVVVFGRAAIVDDPAAARRGLQLLLDKYFPQYRPGRDYRTTTDDELRQTTVYRIAITEWSGKKKEVAPDFPGAFDWPPPGALAE